LTFADGQDLLKGNDATTMRNMLQNNLGSYAQAAVNAGAAASASALQKVLEIQRDWILNKGAGMSENYDYSYGKRRVVVNLHSNGLGNTFGWDSWFLLPFGRGSIRINNADAYSNSFSIDPRFFSNAFDRLAQGASARFTRTACNTSPLNSQVNGEQTPGGAVGGNDLESWASWTQNNYRSNWHPIGTAAMMSKDLGGCVDSRHRVVSCW
jgi:choline dehydrogenase-like flavoprotein